MSVINTSMSAFFAGAETMLTNAREQPEIAALLENYGYGAIEIQEGQTLLNTARSLYDAQIQEYGEQHAATQAFAEATKRADKVYSAHRKLAKIAFKNDTQRQTDLKLNDRKPNAYAAWYEQARHFYETLLSDTEAQAELSKYNISGDALQAAQEQVEQTRDLKSEQEKERGEAQEATKQRDAALEALEEWLSDFKVVARIALQDAPQLLEALGLGAIP